MPPSALPFFSQLWLGGSPNQTRLAKVFAERVKLRDLEATLEPLLAAFKSRRQPGEAFGDFVARVGFAALRSYGDSYVPADKLDKLPTVSMVSLSLFAQLRILVISVHLAGAC
jgi:sulfite reductase (ferredoxin)